MYLVAHSQTYHTYNTHTLINVRVCMCVRACVRMCVCVGGSGTVCVLLSNKILLKDASVIYFNIFLISTFFFTKNTASLCDTFMTISTINTKSGTNGIFASSHKT